MTVYSYLRLAAYLWFCIGTFLAIEMVDAYGKPKQSLWVKVSGGALIVLVWPFLGAFSIYADCRTEKLKRDRKE